MNLHRLRQTAAAASLFAGIAVGFSGCAFSTSELSDKNACLDLPAALEAASEARGLPIRAAVACRAATRVEFLNHAAKSLGEADQLYYDGVALKILGFIPEDFDYARCLATATAADVGAFYDEAAKLVLIPDWQPTAFETLVHESVHALQDQHFDLGKLKATVPENTDAALAFAALVEGDAVAAQAEYSRKNQTQPPRLEPVRSESDLPAADASCRLPENLLFQYEFPYSTGQRYIESAIAAGGREQRDRLFAELPHSTTEVLYRFSRRPALADFDPKPPAVRRIAPGLKPAAAGGGWVERQSDSLGEFSVRTLLRPTLRSKAATLAALGWRGDRFVLWEKIPADGRIRTFHLVWESNWASSGDLTQFVAALVAHFELSPPPARSGPAESYVAGKHHAEGSYLLTTTGTSARLEAVRRLR